MGQPLLSPSSRTVRLEKVKRPGGVFWYDLTFLRQDRHGTWLHGPRGASWGAPHDSGDLPVPVVVLVDPRRPWVGWWVPDPADPRLEIDVCLPPERSDSGWRYVDLELDPVLHLAGSRVEIEDWDEYDEARRDRHLSPDDATLARATAEDLADTLRRGDADWLSIGWDLLRGRDPHGSAGAPS